jgi:hypothetical protein
MCCFSAKVGPFGADADDDDNEDHDMFLIASMEETLFSYLRSTKTVLFCCVFDIYFENKKSELERAYKSWRQFGH